MPLRQEGAGGLVHRLPSDGEGRPVEEAMADRFFRNEMPEFVVEAEGEEAAAAAGTSLLKLLSLPFPSAADRFLRAGLDLKEKVRSLFRPFPLSAARALAVSDRARREHLGFSSAMGDESDHPHGVGLGFCTRRRSGTVPALWLMLEFSSVRLWRRHGRAVAGA